MLQLTNLIGFGAGGKVPLTTLIQVLSSVSTASTITLPAGILAGDLIVLVDFATQSSGLPTLVTPAGFTNIIDTPQVGGIRRVGVCAKIADGSEASAVITGMNGTSQNRKAAIVFRGDSAPVGFSGGGGVIEVNTAAPSNQIQTVSGFITPVVVLALYHSTGTIATRGMSPAKDGEVTIVTNQAFLGFKTYNTAPSDTTISMTDGGTNTMWSGYLQAA